MSKVETVEAEIIEGHIIKNYSRAKELLVEFKKSTDDADIRGAAFLITSLDLFFNKTHTLKNLKEIYTDGGDDNQIDALIINGDDVYVFDITTSSFDQKKVIDFLTSLEAIILDKVDLKNLTNLVLKKQIKKIHKIKKQKIHCLLIRNTIAVPNIPKIEKIIKNLQTRFTALKEVKILSNKNLLEEEKEQSVNPWVIPLTPTHFLSEKDSSEDGHFFEVMFKLEMKEILSFLKKNPSFDIFHRNVRKPQLEKNFSTSLKKSISENHNIFHLLHNGITITANDVYYQSGKLYVINPQVVNGAQTLGILKSIEQTKKLFLYTKIVKSKKELGEQICETANTQKKVETWDLRTNDNCPRRLESFFNLNIKRQFSFIRKKELIKRDNFDKIYFPEYYQWVYASCFSPAVAKDKKSKLFSNQSDGFYDVLDKKVAQLGPSSLNNLAKIGVYVRNKISLENNKVTKGFLRDSNMHIIAGLFFLVDSKNLDSNKMDIFFKKIVSILKEHVKLRKILLKTITNNKVFTKSDEAWNYLQKNIKSINHEK